MGCTVPRHSSFLGAYFADAHMAADRARADVLTRGALLLAHTIREDVPDATAITVETSEAHLLRVQTEAGVVWEHDAPAPNSRLRLTTVDDVHRLLAGMLAFGRDAEALAEAGWVPHLTRAGEYHLPLPDADPCAPCTGQSADRYGVVLTTSAAGGVLYGVDAEVQPGVPSFTIEGLGRSANETRDRVRAGIVNAGLPWPQARVTVRLTPAGEPVRAGTSALDFPIAVALLAASGRLPAECLAGAAMFGELGLDGSLRPVHGMAANAKVLAHRTLIVPTGNLDDAELPSDGTAVHVLGLNEAMADLAGHAHHPADCLHCGRGDRPHAPCTYRLPCRPCRDDGMEPVGA
ncbi:magnesium chelatase domain-containing protein [Streptomyces boncukensis]|uniref:Uncharacterized protein n=1 Tax=Streptomyces boncukensis TaxID=2711219 RepID=A0A6G4WP34_9ACTN|nr:magnesium chelatase domain-containing protein [Streptomyces boncukensis]NGO66783.1 hypothetical protein [Streptomyces boncukensis]